MYKRQAGGDVIGGEGIAVKAIGNGYDAAISIDRYLRGVDLKENRPRKEEFKISPIPKKATKSESRQNMDLLPINERIRIFDEVEIALSEESAIKEASRCLNCNICCGPDQVYDTNIQDCYYGMNPKPQSHDSLDYLDIPKAVIGLLNQNDILPVVLSKEKCCGHDSLWNGDNDTFEKLARYNVQLFKDAGVKTIIFSCAEGYYTWKFSYPSIFEDFDFEIFHITEYILKEGLLNTLTFPDIGAIKITYHDSCRLGRLSNVYDDPRNILNMIPNIELVEMENIKQDASCCGVSAYINCSENSKIIQGNRIKEAINTGADYLIVSCPKCLAHFNCYLNENKELKDQIRIMDLMQFLSKLLFL